MSAESQGTLTGRRLGHYRILERIGRGGMGEVYKGHDENLDRTVAIKAIRAELVSDPQARRRFRDEARRASQIVHPYVATVFDVVDDASSPLLVMEYIDGREFGKAVHKERPSLSRLAHYFLEIAQGLEAIHDSGLIHRDLKPGNIMLSKAGHAKVMDLGLSGVNPLEQETVEESLTGLPTVSTDQSLRGTLAYMSPEQLRTQSIDGRSDLFSLGIVMYQAITGRHPFHTGSLVETASSILSEPPGLGRPSPELQRSGPLRAITLRLLEKDPDQRYQTTAQLVAELESLLETAAFERGLFRPGRRRVLVGGVVVAVVAAIASVAAWRMFQAPTGLGSGRPAVAVLPFEDRTGEAGAGLQATMVADVLSTQLGESQAVRSVPLHRVLEIVGSGKVQRSLTEKLEAVGRGVAARWLLSGTLYRESTDYLCTVVLYDNQGRDQHSFQVRAPRATTLARRAAARAEQWIAGPSKAVLDDDAGPFLTSVSDEAQRAYQRARELEQEERYVDSMQLLERSLGLDPDFARAALLLSDLLDRVGFERRARNQIDRTRFAIEETGVPETNRLALEVEAMHARIYGRTAQALEAYRALAGRFPDEPETLRDLGSALAGRNELEEAARVFEASLKLDALNPRVHLDRATALARMDRLDEAAAGIDEAERLFEMLGVVGDGVLAMTRGKLKREAGDLSGAAQAYHTAAAVYTGQGLEVLALGAVVNEASMELLQWHLDEAEALYLRALPVAREAGHYRLVVKILANLGGQLLRQARFDEAKAALREALDEAMKLEDEALQLTPRINLSAVLNLKQELEEARRQASEVAAMARRRDEPRRLFLATLQLAESDRRAGELAPAARTLRGLADDTAELGSSDAMRAYAFQNLVEVHEDAEHRAGAWEAASEAVRLTSGLDNPARSGYSRIVRARTLAGLGRLDEARADLDEGEKLLAGASPTPRLRESVLLARVALAAADGRWQEVADEARVEGPEGVSRYAALTLARAAGLLGLEQWSEAGAEARRVRDHEGTAAAERVHAELIIAEALGRAGRTAEAGVEALAALRSAEAHGMPLSTARAAAMLYSWHTEVLQRQGFRDKARAALARFLEGVPDPSLEWVRARREVREVLRATGQEEGV